MELRPSTGCICNVMCVSGYSPEQAETLTKVITQSLQSVMAPIERSVLSQRDLVSS